MRPRRAVVEIVFEILELIHESRRISYTRILHYAGLTATKGRKIVDALEARDLIHSEQEYGAKYYLTPLGEEYLEKQRCLREIFNQEHMSPMILNMFTCLRM